MVKLDIGELKKRYRAEKDADVKERILMIMWLESGISSYEVGERLFCPQSKVMYWKRRYKEYGMDGLRTIEKPGRPKSIDSRTEEEIRSELSGKDYWKSSQIAILVKNKSGVTYTQRHIRRLMQKWGYALITPRKKHKNAASPEEVAEFKKSRRNTGFSRERNDRSVHGRIRLCV